MLAAGYVLQVSGLQKSFCNPERSFTLRVSRMEIKAGSVNVIIGRSGCGKSTLLDILGLISTPDSCDALVFRNSSGFWVDSQKESRSGREELRRTSLGYILQTGGLLPFLSVRDNIELPVRLSGKSRKKGWIPHLMERLEITALAKSYPHQLSVGQRQRVAIARSLSHTPNIILADEPTGALDPETALSVKNLLLENARENNVATIIVTHDTELFCHDAEYLFGFHLEATEDSVISDLMEMEGSR